MSGLGSSTAVAVEVFELNVHPKSWLLLLPEKKNWWRTPKKIWSIFWHIFPSHFLGGRTEKNVMDFFSRNIFLNIYLCSFYWNKAINIYFSFASSLIFSHGQKSEPKLNLFSKKKEIQNSVLPFFLHIFCHGRLRSVGHCNVLIWGRRRLFKTLSSRIIAR